ncbi:hypothetical protein K2173_019705 [Erythroxylum novogranatense]|uniref:4-coumarate--CoA ligase n=1 Tax=Erythroxylum novogranatense TaxID=1862640 RepID=A0AAV8SLZ9_9ROSI|nr:hypothetical protein K2173_019705 [Erythroxylum novogranatense]
MERPAENSKPKFSHWYSPETGICSSLHSSRTLPDDPFLDVVSFIFSHKHDGVTAFIDCSSGSSISYLKLLPLVKSVAFGLHNEGIRQGDVVLLLLRNSIYFPLVFLGVLYLGAVVSTMYPLCSAQEIKKRIVDCKALFGIPFIGVPKNGNLNVKTDGFETFNMLLNDFTDLALKPVIRQQDTTAIMDNWCLTHGNFISMVELFVRFEASQYQCPSAKNVYLAVLPMFHIYGLSLFVMGLLSLGSSIVVMRKFDIEETVKVIDEYKITHLSLDDYGGMISLMITEEWIQEAIH